MSSSGPCGIDDDDDVESMVDSEDLEGPNPSLPNQFMTGLWRERGLVLWGKEVVVLERESGSLERERVGLEREDERVSRVEVVVVVVEMVNIFCVVVGR